MKLVSNSLTIESLDTPDYFPDYAPLDEVNESDTQQRRQRNRPHADDAVGQVDEISAHYTPDALRSEHRVTVLIADDERSIADLLAEFLASAGYQVIVAYDGVSAYRLARLYHPELLLTDLFMPGMDGLALQFALRTLPTTRDIPVALMSSARPSAARLHGTPFLEKPFDLDQALDIVEQCVAAPREG